MTSSTLALLRETLAKGAGPAELAKATFQQATSPTSGLTNYDLEAAAKNLYPVLTPLRNEIPRVTDGTGTQANWRGVTGTNVTNVNAGVQEGARGGVMSISTQDFTAIYRTIGLEDSITDESVLAAAGFDDIMARATRMLLEATMISEEAIILGSNSSYALPQSPTPTLLAAATGGTIPASTAVSVICIALTYDGVGNATTSGIVTTGTRQNADGTTTTFNGGAAPKSAAATVTVSTGSTNSVTASVVPLRGAYGYAWFVGAAGSELFYGTTRISQVVITALPPTTNPFTGLATQAASSIGNGNYSQNLLVHDGLLGFAGNPANNSYWQGATPGQGLTADGDGGIVEFDNALQYFWDNLRLSPDLLLVSSQEMQWIRKKILSGQNGSQSTRFVFNVQAGSIVGGGMPKGYLNPFSMSGGPAEIPIMLHPNMVPGTVMFLTKKLPYPMANIPGTMRIKCRKDYYSTTWPRTTRTQFYGVYTDQVLQHYFTPSIGVITNLSPI